MTDTVARLLRDAIRVADAMTAEDIAQVERQNAQAVLRLIAKTKVHPFVVCGGDLAVHGRMRLELWELLQEYRWPVRRLLKEKRSCRGQALASSPSTTRGYRMMRRTRRRRKPTPS